MKEQRKWAGWIALAIMVGILGLALVMTTLAEEKNDNLPEDGAQPAAASQLFPTADHWERIDSDGRGFLYKATQNGALLGHVVESNTSGYAGPIQVIVGIQTDHRLSGIQVGGEQFAETPELGGKARDASFTSQFQGKAIPITLNTDVDAIAGATVTSQAVVDAVNQAVERLYSLDTPQSTQPPAMAKTANASVIGYGGPVLVRLSLDENEAITALTIGGARFQETEGVGSRVKDETFAQTFIGKTPPLTLGEDVDALSGATVSSRAVVDAVNAAAAFLTEEAPTDEN